MKDERSDVTDAESQVLKVLWDRGPGRVRDVQAWLEDCSVAWKRSTVITLLQRLEQKGIVRSNRSGFAFIFSAEISREQFLQQRLDDLAAEFCGGERTPLILAFAQQQQFSEEEVRAFREMIKKSQGGDRTSRSKKTNLPRKKRRRR